jgi:hypothetical protein
VYPRDNTNEPSPDTPGTPEIIDIKARRY